MDNSVFRANAGRKHFNNMYFGDKSELKPYVEADHVSREVAPNAPVTIPVVLFIAQHNFVDSEPSAIGQTGARLARLPGQSMHGVAGTDYLSFNVQSGTTLLQLLQTAVTIDPTFLLFSGSDLTQVTLPDGNLSVFLNHFTHKGASYQSIQTASYGSTVSMSTVRDPASAWPWVQTDPVLNGIWTGWGISYFTNIIRPARFENYPVQAINQFIIHPTVSYQTPQPPQPTQFFTLDFVKSENIW